MRCSTRDSTCDLSLLCGVGWWLIIGREKWKECSAHFTVTNHFHLSKIIVINTAKTSQRAFPSAVLTKFTDDTFSWSRKCFPPENIVSAASVRPRAKSRGSLFPRVIILDQVTLKKNQQTKRVRIKDQCNNARIDYFPSVTKILIVTGIFPLKWQKSNSSVAMNASTWTPSHCSDFHALCFNAAFFVLLVHIWDNFCRAKNHHYADHGTTPLFQDYSFASNIEKESLYCIYVLPGLGLKYRLEYSRLSRSQYAEAALVPQLKYYKPRFTQWNKDVGLRKVRIYLTNIYRFFMREEFFLDFVKVLSVLSKSLHELFLKAKIKPSKKTSPLKCIVYA